MDRRMGSEWDLRELSISVGYSLRKRLIEVKEKSSASYLGWRVVRSERRLLYVVSDADEAERGEEGHSLRTASRWRDDDGGGALRIVESACAQTSETRDFRAHGFADTWG